MELALTLVEDDENPVVGDLRLRNHRLVFATNLAEEVAQRLLVRFKFFQREWFLDLNAGTPYLTAVFEKGVPESTIRAVLTAIVATTVGVAGVDSLDFTIDADRTLELRFVARLQDGTSFRSTSYGPYVISLPTRV